MKSMPGVFRLADTHGIPLEILVQIIDDRGMVVAWDLFVDDARSHGWQDKTIRRKAIAAIAENFPRDYLVDFTKRLDIYLAKV